MASPTPTLREEFSQMLRDRILAVAHDLFSRQGYHATTVRQIALGAGVTHTTLYSYFDNKAEIVVRLAARAFPELERLAASLDGVALEFDAVRGWVRDYARVWRAHRGAFESFWEAAMADPQMAARLLPAVVVLARKMVSAFAGLDGPAARAREREIGLAFLGVHQMLAITRVATAGVADEETVLDGVARFMLASLTAWRQRS